VNNQSSQAVPAVTPETVRTLALSNRFQDRETLHSLDLTNAQLAHTSFKGARLTYLDLSGADLSYADLREADLEGTSLVGANLTGAKLNRAKLNDTNLSYANLSGADLRSVTLSLTHLDGTLQDDKTRWSSKATSRSSSWSSKR
jgi:uncharacterized protein YjbI with pentapeptide repeats